MIKLTWKKVLAAFTGATVSASIVSVLYYLLNDEDWLRIGITNFFIILGVFLFLSGYAIKRPLDQ